MTDLASRKGGNPTATPVRLLVVATAVLLTGLAAFLAYFGKGPGWAATDGIYSGKASIAAPGPAATSPYPASGLNPQATAAIAEPEKKAALLDALGNAALRWTAFSNASDQRVIDLHLETAFAPEALVSSKQLSESFQKIERLQDLQRRSEETRNAYFAELESAIRSSGLSQSTVETQLALFKTSREQSLKLHDELQGLENLTAKSAIAILNFAQRELGKTAVGAGELVFQSPSQAQEYQRLMADLVRNSTAQNTASVRISELQQKQKSALEAGLRR